MKLEGIQVARSLAALAVVYYHSAVCFRAFPDTVGLPLPILSTHGFVGVNFFFAISGFVICLVISKESHTTLDFISKRFFRLYPIWFLVFGVALLFSWLGFRISGMQDGYTIEHLIKSALFFPLQVGPVYDVTWSLEHEIVFYVIAGLVAPLLPARFRALGLMVVVLALALYGHLYYGGGWDYHIFRAPHSDFLAGIIAFQFRGWLQKIGVIVPFFIGIFGHYLTHGPQIPYMGSIGSILLLTAFLNLEVKDVVTMSIAKLGDASYSLYLSHWLIFYLAIPCSASLVYIIHPEVWRFFVIAVCISASILLYKWVESPVIAFGNRFIGAKKVPK